MGNEATVEPGWQPLRTGHGKSEDGLRYLPVKQEVNDLLSSKKVIRALMRVNRSRTGHSSNVLEPSVCCSRSPRVASLGRDQPLAACISTNVTDLFPVGHGEGIGERRENE